jgi:hypothetical protein
MGRIIYFHIPQTPNSIEPFKTGNMGVPNNKSGYNGKGNNCHD